VSVAKSVLQIASSTARPASVSRCVSTAGSANAFVMRLARRIVAAEAWILYCGLETRARWKS